MNRVLTITALGCLLVPATAAAKTSSVPSISFVTPMRAKVGKTLTVRGAHFAKSPRANKVVLEGASGRKVIVVPSKASSTKLVLTIPKSAERILKAQGGVGQPTRTYLRVITKVYGKRSALTHSPVIVSARAASDSAPAPASKPASPVSGKPLAGNQTGGSGSGAAIPAACGTGTDWDNDLLDNATELRYGLDPCRADSDGDSMGDGWEYWAARDLNVRAVPYPGKKPYPNPLDGSDLNIDFDGDSLTSSQEHRAWVVTGRAFDRAAPNSPLGYSDGTQASRPTEVPAVPAFRAAQYGLNQTPPAYPAADQITADGIWTDEERDADADGLNNFVETNGPGHFAWWTAALGAQKPTPPETWPGTDPNDPANYSKNYYGVFTQRPFQDTALDDPDVDGDTLLDGEDDQDADDVPNYTEMLNPYANYSNGNRKNAFNPCAPVTNSRTCPRYFPF